MAMPTLSSACYFLMGLGKFQLRAKFEVASTSRCINILGKPKIVGSSPSPRPPLLFQLCVILCWALANPSSVPNFKSLASAVAEILQGKPQISRSSTRGPHSLFLLVGFDDGPWQFAAACQI